jgi:16S rRNA (cytosine967-C5)-methyltransferase
MPKLSPARQAAFAILLELEGAEAHSDNLLRARAVSKLSAADRNLTTALVLGVLRWALALDRRYRPLLAKPNARLDAEVRVALRLGAYQILRMDRIPARAAIDESVELVKQAGHRFASGLVNAVLRKLAEQPAAEFADAEAYPEWMVERWRGFYGDETAQAICRHGQAQPTLALRLATPEAEDELQQSGVTLTAGELLTAARRVVAGDAAASQTVLGRRARIQDEGSQLIAELACFPAAQKILDACAAPGGKTLILAERAPAAQIVANEASTQRLEILRKRLKDYADRVECRLGDAAALGEEAVYDLALVDAPCSGTGTLGRNPEIRYRLALEDLSRQAERQLAILLGAARALKPGGRLVYSTCSLEPEENEQVVSALLAHGSDLRLAPMRPRIEELRAQSVLTAAGAEKLCARLTPEGSLRLTPGQLQTDGFFVALFEKTI